MGNKRRKGKTISRLRKRRIAQNNLSKLRTLAKQTNIKGSNSENPIQAPSTSSEHLTQLRKKHPELFGGETQPVEARPPQEETPSTSFKEWASTEIPSQTVQDVPSPSSRASSSPDVPEINIQVPNIPPPKSFREWIAAASTAAALNVAVSTATAATAAASTAAASNTQPTLSPFSHPVEPDQIPQQSFSRIAPQASQLTLVIDGENKSITSQLMTTDEIPSMSTSSHIEPEFIELPEPGDLVMDLEEETEDTESSFLDNCILRSYLLENNSEKKELKSASQKKKADVNTYKIPKEPIRNQPDRTLKLTDFKCVSCKQKKRLKNVLTTTEDLVFSKSTSTTTEDLVTVKQERSESDDYYQFLELCEKYLDSETAELAKLQATAFSSRTDLLVVTDEDMP